MKVLKLDPAWGHGTMLNDPGVRQQIQQIYVERNQVLGVDPAIEQVVWAITIQLATQDDRLNPFNDFGTFDTALADIVDRMEINAALPKTEPLKGRPEGVGPDWPFCAHFGPVHANPIRPR